MLNGAGRRLLRAPENLRRRAQARVSARLCARHADPLAESARPLVSIFFDVEGDYAMPGMQRACIDTMAAILRIQGDLGLRATYNVVANLALDAPAMVADTLANGHEIASHSLQHRVLTGLSPQALRSDLADARQALERLDVAVAGHRSPQSAWTRALLEELWRQGYSWNAEDGAEPYPYPLVESGGRRLWRLPVRGDDWLYESSDMNPAALLAHWQRLVSSHVEQRRFVAIGFHPWVEARRERLAAFRDFMIWLSEYPGIDILPLRDVVSRCEGAARSARPELAHADA